MKTYWWGPIMIIFNYVLNKSNLYEALDAKIGLNKRGEKDDNPHPSVIWWLIVMAILILIKEICRYGC